MFVTKEGVLGGPAGQLCTVTLKLGRYLYGAPSCFSPSWKTASGRKTLEVIPALWYPRLTAEGSAPRGAAAQGQQGLWWSTAVLTLAGFAAALLGRVRGETGGNHSLSLQEDPSSYSSGT